MQLVPAQEPFGHISQLGGGGGQSMLVSQVSAVGIGHTISQRPP